MNIEHINKRHFKKYNSYYNSEYGISTRLISYKNCILNIEILNSSGQKKPPYKIAFDIAKHWKNSHPEFKFAIGAKVFIADLSTKDQKNPLTEIKIKYKKGILFNFWSKN